jgi:hypothetical protein
MLHPPRPNFLGELAPSIRRRRVHHRHGFRDAYVPTLAFHRENSLHALAKVISASIARRVELLCQPSDPRAS